MPFSLNYDYCLQVHCYDILTNSETENEYKCSNPKAAILLLEVREHKNGRLIMVKDIAHAAVAVKDMEESLRFYTLALGFQNAFQILHPETEKPWIIYLGICPGRFLELFYGGETEHPWEDTQIGFNHLCFEVDDIFALVERVREAGYPIDAEPKQGSDHNWQAWIKDPNGVRIELMQVMPESPQAQFYFQEI